MMDNKIQVGLLLKEARIKKDLSQSELAELTGLRQATISEIENGTDFKLSTLLKIMDALGLNLCELK